METELREGDPPPGDRRPDVSPRPEGFVEAFDELYRRAYQQAYKLNGDRPEAEDIAQEACTRAYLQWRKLDNPQAWVVRVATNLAFDRFRRLRNAAKHTRSAGAAAASVDDRHLDLHRALSQLPKRQREVVALRYLADMSEAQTAAALGCTSGTVKTHAARGLRALRATTDLTDQLEES